MKLATFLTGIAGCVGLATPTKAQGGLRWLGANEAGAEFGETTLPGELGDEYTWPDPNAVDTLIADGMNLFRIPFRMERLSPDTVVGAFAEKYLGDLNRTVRHITGQGAWAVLDPHNYGRYYDDLLAPEGFQTFWANLAEHFIDDDHAIFDTNNEYHDMDQELVLNLNQAAIDGIRSSGATSQYIFVEGNSWTGAWTWVDENDSMKSLTDPEDKIIYEMHQYFDETGSSSITCVSPTIGQERLVSATEWLRNNSKQGVIGEYAGTLGETCQAAVEGMIEYMDQNSDVWTGALWWAAGPWWGDGDHSYEPPDGPAYPLYKPILQPYFPGSGPNATRRN